MANGNYTSAEQDFSGLSGYRDAASLSVYCKYADMYKDRTEYAGGQDELSNITLQYDTSWQQDVDALETRVKGYKAEKDATEEAERQRIAAENAAKREQSLKDQYSGKLPVEGMPVSCLKYTSLGEPDKRLNCKNFEKLEQNQKYFNVYWYDENGEMIAAGMCAQWKNDSEYMLKSFSQYYPSGGNNGRPSITAMEAAIPEASGMTMTIPKTSGKITKIGMRTRMKRGMSGMMVNLQMRVPVSSDFNSLSRCPVHSRGYSPFQNRLTSHYAVQSHAER